MSHSLPIVSVIIPHFARPELLRESVSSVLASTEERVEIIVVDDGSPEEDWAAIQALSGPRVSLYRRLDGRKGPSRCRNIGLQHAAGEFVMFLDSDDLMAPWCLRRRLALAGSDSGAAMLVFPVMLFRDRPGDCGQLWNRMGDEPQAAARFARSDPPWHTSSPLWRTARLRELGGFNEAVFYGDDGELHLRALVSGLPAKLFPDEVPDVFIRRSDAARITNSLTSSLLESRRVRLLEGSRFLQQHPERKSLGREWEGQYFAEAEFLLFNHSPSRPAIRQVLDDWRRLYSPPLRLRWTVVLYMQIAMACKRHAYLILRIARRIAMKMLPGEFFPSASEFEQAMPAPSVQAKLEQQLAHWFTEGFNP